MSQSNEKSQQEAQSLINWYETERASIAPRLLGAFSYTYKSLDEMMLDMRALKEQRYALIMCSYKIIYTVEQKEVRSQVLEAIRHDIHTLTTALLGGEKPPFYTEDFIPEEYSAPGYMCTSSFPKEKRAFRTALICCGIRSVDTNRDGNRFLKGFGVAAGAALLPVIGLAGLIVAGVAAKHVGGEATFRGLQGKYGPSIGRLVVLDPEEEASIEMYAVMKKTETFCCRMHMRHSDDDANVFWKFLNDAHLQTFLIDDFNLQRVDNIPWRVNGRSQNLPVYQVGSGERGKPRYAVMVPKIQGWEM